jgi:hypothetical protein
MKDENTLGQQAQAAAEKLEVNNTIQSPILESDEDSDDQETFHRSKKPRLHRFKTFAQRVAAVSRNSLHFAAVKMLMHPLWYTH